MRIEYMKYATYSWKKIIDTKTFYFDGKKSVTTVDGIEPRKRLWDEKIEKLCDSRTHSRNHISRFSRTKNIHEKKKFINILGEFAP